MIERTAEKVTSMSAARDSVAANAGAKLTPRKASAQRIAIRTNAENGLLGYIDLH